MKISMDISEKTILLVCECGYRQICTTKKQATQTAANHAKRAHKDYANAQVRKNDRLHRHTEQI